VLASIHQMPSLNTAPCVHPSTQRPTHLLRPQLTLQRLSQELLRHFGLSPSGGAAAGAALTGPSGGAGAGEWHVLLFPDVSAHCHLKNTSWGPAYPHDVTVSAV
jgi:hypothetical protein